MEVFADYNELECLRDCVICPRECHADRFSGKPGYCRVPVSYSASSVCIHRGEEPVISGSKGICNVFFPHCNLQCSYCQNHQISHNYSPLPPGYSAPGEIVLQITRILDTGINSVGFVSPSHMVPQMKVVIKEIERMGYHPIWVYNSNGYDKVETLRELEGIIDVYLPDFKYMDTGLSGRLSGAPDYPEVAAAAIREMIRQKGTTLRINDEGYAESGVLIRHLVLPGYVENSIRVLKYIAEEISPLVHIGLMSQYFPVYRAPEDPVINRSLQPQEYGKVVRAMEEFGLHRGFIQELQSFNHYRPDFNKNHPFE